MTRMMTLAAGMIAVVLVVGQRAEACSCAAPPPPKAALEQAAAVFAGKVVKVQQVEFQNHVTFEVTSVWKGEVGKQVTITTATSGAACGYHFTTKGDGAYLVYCYKPKDAKFLATNICTRTKSLGAAKEDLAAIGKGEKPKGKDV